MNASLAEAGDVALAVDMYGDGKATTHPHEAPAMRALFQEVWR